MISIFPLVSKSSSIFSSIFEIIQWVTKLIETIATFILMRLKNFMDLNTF